MDAVRPKSTTEFADLLFKQAVAAYGQERAGQLKQSLDRLAENLAALDAYTPKDEVEPAFYLGTAG